FAFLASNATADMICPDWQYPHCGTSSSIHAFCTGWEPSAERPSIVVIFFPAMLETAVMHERAGSPSMCTVQAPHSAMPQPNFVPVIFSVSRSTHRRGIWGSTLTVVAFPFSVNVTAISPSLGAADIVHQLPAWMEIRAIPCRRKMRMSGLCKVEMSGSMDGRGAHGNGADRFEPTRAGPIESVARDTAEASDASSRGPAAESKRPPGAPDAAPPSRTRGSLPGSWTARSAFEP